MLVRMQQVLTIDCMRVDNLLVIYEIGHGLEL